MKDQTLLFVYFLVLCVFCSCKVYNPTMGSSFKKFAAYPCRAKQKNVFLFFENDTVDFKFKKLGSIETFGKASDDEGEITDRLKYTAFQNCANAVIGINTQTVTKNYGGEYRTGSKTYVSKIYKGVAVRIESDSLYKSNKLGNSQDLSFIKNTIKYTHERKKKAISTAVFAVAFAAVFVGIYVLTAYH
ncbi:MAG: hypothetical protein V4635_11315 [Bacteroidota bacterium]